MTFLSKLFKHPPPIANTNLYNVRMEKSMADKLFFVNFFGDRDDFPIPDVFIDFGCADGAMLENLAALYPKSTLIGFDTNKDMLELAKKRVPNAYYINDVKALVHFVRSFPGPTCLILSSIIHEVYSYDWFPFVFWKHVADMRCDFICIREMAVEEDTTTNIVPEIVESKIIDEMRSRDKLGYLMEFEDMWGSISVEKNLAHYLMKYRYTNNWFRELNEDYLPLTVEDLRAKMPDGYEEVYFQHRTLPWLEDKIELDFNIDFTTKTHAKLIWRKR